MNELKKASMLRYIRLVVKISCLFFFFNKKNLSEVTFIDFIEREEGREKNISVTNIDQLSHIGTLTGDRTHNLDLRPDWELSP